MSVSTFSEPFTPRGVAAFARAKLNRLLLAQSIFAALTASAIAWFFYDGYYPTIQEAIQNLPADGQIRSGQLNWRADSPQTLAEGHFLAFDVDLNHSGQFRSTADFQIEFGRDTVRFFSLFGYADFFYASDEITPFNRTELEPLWKAWRMEILFLIGVAMLISLLATWWILTTVYFLPVWILGFFVNRDLNFRASWKLSGASLLPGAILMTVGILLYDFGFLNLVSFAFVFAAHFVLGWFYLLFGLFFLSRISETAKKNPFKMS